MNTKKESGFTLFIAMVVMGTMLLVAAGIVSLAVRQTTISRVSRESQRALYIANTGLECALYWDVQNPSGTTAFATTTGTVYSISCNQDANNPANPTPSNVGGGLQSQFIITFNPDPSCAEVTVTKDSISGTTTIESKGYNTCDVTDSRRVERAVRATY